MENKSMTDIPSDVVELIIAVDLNPKDPQEPINVNDVTVKPKGEHGEPDGDENWKDLVTQLLMGNPESGVTSDSITYDEAVEAVSRVLESKDGTDVSDMFSKASEGRSRKPKDMPMHSGGGMRAALKRALGKTDDVEMDDSEEEEE